MDDVTLCWATVKCSKSAPTARNPHSRISNTFDIALDASEVWGQKFVCPCCGEELHVELADKGDIPKGIRDEIINEKRAQTYEHFKTFAGVSAFLIAAMAARVFLFADVDSAKLAFNLITVISFALVWLPYFVFMVWLSGLSSNGVKILRDYERKHPGEIIILVQAGKSECSHTLEYFPELEAESEEAAERYGLDKKTSGYGF